MTSLEVTLPLILADVYSRLFCWWQRRWLCWRNVWWWGWRQSHWRSRSEPLCWGLQTVETDALRCCCWSVVALILLREVRFCHTLTQSASLPVGSRPLTDPWAAGSPAAAAPRLGLEVRSHEWPLPVSVQCLVWKRWHPRGSHARHLAMWFHSGPKLHKPSPLPESPRPLMPTGLRPSLLWVQVSSFTVQQQIEICLWYFPFEIV